MSILKKIVDLFSEEVENEKKDEEREKLQQELLEESKKYQNITPRVEQPKELEEVQKQVLFVDEDFERREKVVEKQQTPAFTSNKYVSDEPKFKPSNYISPVHGLIKEAEDFEVQELEEKTTSESDYSKIRERVFNDKSTEKNNFEDSENFKIFKTSEIINIKKRIQVDESEVYDANTSIEDAYGNATNDSYVDTKSLSNHESKPDSDLFNLLDDLKEDKNEL